MLSSTCLNVIFYVSTQFSKSTDNHTVRIGGAFNGMANEIFGNLTRRVTVVSTTYVWRVSVNIDFIPQVQGITI